MERLTYDFALGGNHCWQVKGADNLECREVCERQGDDGCKTCPIAKAFDRLAAYEDTGLEPEEIAKIREDAENGYMKSTARRYGIPVDRLRELAEADREGRIRIEARAYQCPKCGAYRLVPRMDNQFYYCFHCKTQLPAQRQSKHYGGRRNDRHNTFSNRGQRCGYQLGYRLCARSIKANRRCAGAEGAGWL